MNRWSILKQKALYEVLKKKFGCGRMKVCDNVDCEKGLNDTERVLMKREFWTENYPDVVNWCESCRARDKAFIDEESNFCETSDGQVFVEGVK